MSPRNRLAALAALGILASSCSLAVSARDWFVAANGNDAWSTPGTIEQPFKTISRATWSGFAGPGDSIQVRGGTYLLTGGEWIGAGGAAGNPLTVRPYQSEQVILDGSGTTSTVLGVGASHVVVEGFEVRNAGRTGIGVWGGDAGAPGIEDIVVRNNVIHDCQRGGIYAGHAIGETTTGLQNLLIEGNVVYHTSLMNAARTATSSWSSGIGVGSSQDAIVRNNTVYENYGEGIIAGDSRRVQVLGNRVYDNYSVNLYIDRATQTRHEGNLVYSTGNSAYFRQVGGQWVPASGIQIANENETNWATPIWSSDNVIVNNLFIGNRNAFHYGNYQGGGGMRSVLFAFNTIYGAVVSALSIDADTHTGSEIANNLWVQTAAPIGGGTQTGLNGSLAGLSFHHNLWSGGLPQAGAQSASDVNAAPGLADPGGFVPAGYGLQPGSAATAAGTALAAVTQDYAGRPRAAAPSLGAFEAVAVAPRRTWHVATTGNDAADGSAAGPWRTLSRAAAADLQPGDLVLVQPGTYPEDLALTRSGAAVLPVTTGVAVTAPDTLRFPVGTDLSGIDLAGHPGEYQLYCYRSWRANNGVYEILAKGADAQGPWVRVAGASFVAETGTAGDVRAFSAAVGRPIVLRNAASDPATARVVLDASSDPAIYTVLYIGRYLNPADADPVNWTIVDGIDVTGSQQGGGVHIQDSSYNVVMNSRVYDLQGAGILIAGNEGHPARYNLVWNNVIYNTPTEGVYVGAGGHGAAANHADFTHVIGNDISTQGTAANARLENAIDLKEFNTGDLVAGNLIHDFVLISQSNGALDIRNGKQDVLAYNNVFRNIGKANSGANSVIHLYAGSNDIQIFNNLLTDTTGGGAGVYAFNIDGGGSSGVLIANNSVRGYNRGLLLEQYGGVTDVRFENNVFDFTTGGIVEWGTAGRFTLSHNLYAANPGAYAAEPARLIGAPLWVAPASGDLHLQAGSPAIDSGLEQTAVAIDLERAPRPSGSAWDRGAYEREGGVVIPTPVAAFSGAPVAGTAPLTVRFTDQSSGTPSAWSWDFGDGGTAATQAPSHLYAAPGSYSVTLRVTNAAGTNSLTRPALIQVAAPAARQTIFSNGFETGLTGWYRQGSVTWYAGTPRRGTRAMRFTGNNVWVERTVSTAGFRDIKLSVYMGAQSFENWEYLVLYWYDGQQWQEPVTVDNHHAASDGQLHLIEVSLPAAAANSPGFKIAFGMWDTDTKDFAYIDDVLVSGVPTQP